MRILLGAAVVLALVGGRVVEASCVAPQSVAENAARAVVVVHGTVASAGTGSISLRVDRVFKGNVAAALRVFVGPERGASGGGIAVTSVDYAAAVGTDHVIYAVKGQDGQLETNACIGSHPGAPTAEETAFFGAGLPPSEGGVAFVTDHEQSSPWTALALAIAIALALLATVFLLRRRALRVRATERRDAS